MAKQLKKVSDNTTQGAIQGGAYGAIAGFVNSAWENHAQMVADRRSRKFQEEQAQKQFNRQQYFDNLEKRWNSEQAQVQRMRDAGLNPNLMYGDLSASTVNTPQVPLPSTPNGVSRDFSLDSSALQGAATGIDEIFKAASVDNLNQNTAKQFQDTIGEDIANRYKESNLITGILHQLAEIEKLKSDALKNQADTKTLDALRDSLLEKAMSEIELNKQRVKESEQAVEKSKQDVNESKSRVDVNKQNIAESGQRIEQSKQTIEESKQNVKESISREKLNNAIEQLRHVETKDLLLKYNVTNDQYQMINKFVHEHDLPAGSEKVIIEAFENFARSTGENVPKTALDILKSWLDGGNWLDFFNDRQRNEVIEKGNQQNFEAQEHRTDAIKQGFQNESADGVPNIPKDLDKEWDAVYTPNEKQYIINSREYYKYLNYDKRQQLQRLLDKNYKNFNQKQLKAAELTHKLYYEQYGTFRLPKDEK